MCDVPGWLLVLGPIAAGVMMGGCILTATSRRALAESQKNLGAAWAQISRQSAAMARVVDRLERVQGRLTPESDQEAHWKGFRGPMFKDPAVPRTEVERRDQVLHSLLESAKQELVGE